MRASSTPSMPLQTQGKRRIAASDPPVKRFRVSRACDICRIERSKCDGKQPQCAPCAENSRQCSYTSNPKKRGLPPGYIRTIELALALVFQDHADIEASLIAKLGQPNTVLVARDTKESSKLHRSWRRTKFCREMNKTLTGESGPGHEDLMSSGDESDGAIELENSISYTLPESLPLQDAQLHELPVLAPTGPLLSQNSTSTSLTALPHECWKMLEDYSTYTQCWFPISERLDILKLSYSYPSQGLLLSPDMLEGGGHAEMWSMLALHPSQGPSARQPDTDYPDVSSPSNFYTISRGLIPTELGKFQIGHVKALLNLALVNIRRSSLNAAWILVGAASRIIPTIEHRIESHTSRHAHVVASCYLLDNLLALSLNRHPYMDRSDLDRAGKIEEDGLEEWQPWVGEVNTSTGHQPRSPALALSSFNCLIDLVDILVRSGKHPRARNELLRELAAWKTALPPKLEYIRSDSVPTPSNPPAILLRLTHLATTLALSPSQMWLEKVTTTLEMFQQQLGSAKLPQIITCVLQSARKTCKEFPVDQTLQLRFERCLSRFKIPPSIADRAMPQATRSNVNNAFTRDQYPQSGSSQIMSTSYSPHFVEAASGHQSQRQQQQQQQPYNHTSLLDDLLPDMNPNQPPQISQTSNFSPNPVDTDLTSPALDAYDPSISGDLESFFDELASLHGAKKLQNQPQFMQNLGFAPEVSMADLLATQSGHFMPMNPSTFGNENDEEPLQFPLSDYYNPS